MSELGQREQTLRDCLVALGIRSKLHTALDGEVHEVAPAA
eukprot:CAMPEP_0204341258 /NCGR_PEP_ID=MMETSP0469-20131031/23208_1 /ASSEMBLY_ACC=CAM_ASM_000384 /TAXON_ID=2969 /ORGANISM="Oxyrrhis marina" /LENGTH=39 /DNA_ID= /DNA_START= /DNA_END= /DNA_ORIENTATION=